MPVCRASASGRLNRPGDCEKTNLNAHILKMGVHSGDGGRGVVDNRAGSGGAAGPTAAAKHRAVRIYARAAAFPLQPLCHRDGLADVDSADVDRLANEEMGTRPGGYRGAPGTVGSDARGGIRAHRGKLDSQHRTPVGLDRCGADSCRGARLRRQGRHLAILVEAGGGKILKNLTLTISASRRALRTEGGRHNSILGTQYS